MTATVTPIKRKKKSVYSPGYVETLGPLTSFLPGYELHLRSSGQADKTVEKKLIAVRQLAAFLGDPDVGTVTRADIQGWMAHRLTVVSRASVATEVVALRSFFGPLKGDAPGYLAIDLGTFETPMRGISAPAAEEPAATELPTDLLSGMIAACERPRHKSFEDVRDAALLRCFIDTGCRLSEITGVTLGEIVHLADGRMKLVVFGKGRGGGPRRREVPLGTKAGQALRRYLRMRADHTSAALPDLWLGRRGKLLNQGVRRIIERRSTAAGRRIHPHELRHDWAVKMKADERNRDADIMDLAGWTDPRMMARYGKAATAKRAAANFWAHGAPGDAL